MKPHLQYWPSATPIYVTLEPKGVCKFRLHRAIPRQKLHQRQYISIRLQTLDGFQHLIQVISRCKQCFISDLTENKWKWVVWGVESLYDVSFCNRHSIFPKPDLQYWPSATHIYVTLEPKAVYKFRLNRAIPHQKFHQRQYISIWLQTLDGFQHLIQVISRFKQCFITENRYNGVVWGAESLYGVSFCNRHSIFPKPDLQYWPSATHIYVTLEPKAVYKFLLNRAIPHQKLHQRQYISIRLQTFSISFRSFHDANSVSSQIWLKIGIMG